MTSAYKEQLNLVHTKYVKERCFSVDEFSSLVNLLIVQDENTFMAFPPELIKLMARTKSLQSSVDMYLSAFEEALSSFVITDADLLIKHLTYFFESERVSKVHRALSVDIGIQVGQISNRTSALYSCKQMIENTKVSDAVLVSFIMQVFAKHEETIGPHIKVAHCLSKEIKAMAKKFEISRRMRGM